MNDFWRTALGSGLIGLGGGNPAFAFMMAQQERDRQAQKQALKPVASAFADYIPQVNVSPKGALPGTFDYGGSPVPPVGQLAPLIGQALASGADPQSLAPFLSLSQSFMPKPPEAPIVTKPGDILRDPRNPMRILGQNPTAPEIRESNGQLGTITPEGFSPIPGAPKPAPDKGTAAHQDALNLGLQPGTKPYNDYVRERTLPKPNQININQPPSGYVPAPTPEDPFAVRPMTGGPADPNRPREPTQDQLKNQQLYLTSRNQLKIIDDNFDELAKFGSQVGGKVNPALTSQGYQRAKAAISDIIANFIYSVSGATANPGEVATRTEIAIPFIGEAKESVADKKARIQAMVESIRIRAEGGSMESAARAFEEATAPRGSGPKPGTIEDGYRFKGGNPADPNSWEKVS